MFLFVLGASLMYALLAGAALVMERAVLLAQPRLGAFVLLSALVVPSVVTWAVLEMINLVSPRRLLDRRVRRPWARVVDGAIAGTLGACIGAVSLALLDWSVPDAVLTASSAAVATAITALPLRRVRRAECVHCGYDLSGMRVAPGRSDACACPECGRTLMAA